MSATRFLAGFIVGGAIGAITGILLAPKSGEETRAMLADSAKQAMKKADATVKEIQSISKQVPSKKTLGSEASLSHSVRCLRFRMLQSHTLSSGKERQKAHSLTHFKGSLNFCYQSPTVKTGKEKSQPNSLSS